MQLPSASSCFSPCPSPTPPASFLSTSPSPSPCVSKDACYLIYRAVARCSAWSSVTWVAGIVVWWYRCSEEKRWCSWRKAGRVIIVCIPLASNSRHVGSVCVRLLDSTSVYPFIPFSPHSIHQFSLLSEVCSSACVFYIFQACVLVFVLSDSMASRCVCVGVCEPWWVKKFGRANTHVQGPPSPSPLLLPPPHNACSSLPLSLFPLFPPCLSPQPQPAVHPFLPPPPTPSFLHPPLSLFPLPYASCPVSPLPHDCIVRTACNTLWA